MKTRFQLLFCSVIWTGFVYSQTNSTIWLKREGRKAGSGCGVQIQIGNQQTFNVSNKQVVKYTLLSTGRIQVSAELLMCAAVYNKQQVTLKVEPGKEYFLLLDHGKPELMLTMQ